MGNDGNACHVTSTVIGAVAEGELWAYTAPVIDSKGPSDMSHYTPALYGMHDLRKRNIFVNARGDQLISIPNQCSEKDIKWPEGRQFYQCARSPSGHMILVTSHWKKFAERLNKSTPEQLQELLPKGCRMSNL